MDQTSETEKVYQRQKYDEIIEILLSAGYFRARINTLSEFDKVVGGLCWCITSSGEDVDVDILFQENSTIGQKIALSEAIVTALRKMNCPSNLQPHQIQGGVGGSDYPAIFPVIVWLVKKFYERRDEREAQLRAFSTLQFSKNFQFPHESESRAVSADLAAILERNKARRLFKCRPIAGASEEIKVRSCLLEYGETFATGGSAGEEGGGDSSRTKRGEAAHDEVTGSSAASVAVVHSAMLETGKRVIHIQGDGNAEVSLAGLTRMAGAAGRGEGLSGFEKKLAQAHAGELSTGHPTLGYTTSTSTFIYDYYDFVCVLLLLCCRGSKGGGAVRRRGAAHAADHHGEHEPDRLLGRRGHHYQWLVRGANSGLGFQ